MGTTILALANTLTASSAATKGKTTCYFGLDVDEATDTSYKMTLEEVNKSVFSSKEELNLFKTTVDATNFQKLRFFYNGDAAEISTLSGGTGNALNLIITGTNGLNLVAGNATAVTFQRGVTTTWRINASTSDWEPGTTGAYDIGSIFLRPCRLWAQDQLLIGGATLASNAPLLFLAQTWNNAGVNFTAIDLDVTNTASGATSKLLDLKVGGVSKFSVDKNGNVPVKDQTLTDAATVAWDASLGQTARVTLGGSRALGKPTNITEGMTLVLRVVQDGVGSHTLSYHADVLWPGGTAPTLSTAAGSIDVLTFVVHDVGGTLKLLGSSVLDMQ